MAPFACSIECMSPDARVWYRINKNDEITCVGGGWEHFAKENDGHGLDGETLQGRVLWEFISGPATRDLYKRLLTRVRSGQTARFTLRCDGPAYRRLLEMTISMEKDDTVEFATRSLKVVERDPIALLAASTTRSEAMLVVCAWCNRIQVSPQEWMEVELAIDQLNLFEADRMPQVSHGICNDCLETMTELVEKLEPGR